jgi:hypothetical protein
VLDLGSFYALREMREGWAAVMLYTTASLGKGGFSYRVAHSPLRPVGYQIPYIPSPMAGGWTTPALVSEVSDAGGLGMLAGLASRPTGSKRTYGRLRRGQIAPSGSTSYWRARKRATEIQSRAALFGPLSRRAEPPSWDH